MFLTPYFSTLNNEQFQFTRRQASHFAKIVAGDFNPIHDENNKRFCVPGDLLFAVLLDKEGISQKMHFDFSGMVNDGIALQVKNKCENISAVVDNNDKEYLHMSREGDVAHDSKLIECVIKSYVQFSGMNFPHILVPLMEEKQVMINCQRPLVIYESMGVTFEHLDLHHPEIELSHTTFDIEGKRGAVTLNFNFKEEGKLVGQGVKRLLLSGLRPYNKADIEALVSHFFTCKETFLSKLTDAVP